MPNVKKISREEIEDIVALTPLQEGMLFHYLKNPAADLYFEQFCLAIDGIVDVDLFRQAWNAVVETNEMLRTAFRWEGVEKPLQLVLRNHLLEPRYFIFPEDDILSQSEWLVEIRGKDRQNRFDLREVPFRVTLCRLSHHAHEMIISSHHILFDGWSTGIILHEFLDAYKQAAGGRLPVRAAKTRFREYVKRLRSIDTAQQKKFWIRYLDGFDQFRKFVLINRKKERRGSLGNYRVTFPRSEKERLYRLARENRLTPAAFFCCAWGILLQKYQGSREIVFGTTFSGRWVKIKEIEKMVGLFIHTLPLRIGCHPHERIDRLLTGIHEDMQEMEKFCGLSLADINEYAGLAQGEQLFDTLLVVENYPLDFRLRQAQGGLAIRPAGFFESTEYDLTVGITLLEGVEINFTYNPEVLTKPDIEMAGSHFSRIIREIMAHPDRPLSRISMLSEGEKNRLLHDFNLTRRDFPRNETLPALFEQQVASSPDHTAVVGPVLNPTFTDPVTCSYGMLNAESHRLARLLTEKGLGVDSIAAIMIERSLQMVIGILGILKSGGAYLPLDPEYPQARISYMLADSNAAMLLTAPPAGEGPVFEFKGDILYLDGNGNGQGDPDRFSPGRRQPATAAAYIIYTSGSTGIPKGTAVDHYSVVNILTNLEQLYPMGEGGTYLLKTNYTFDVSVTELFSWFLGGGRLVILEPGSQKDPERMIDTMVKSGVTHINFVPSMWNSFLDFIDEKAAGNLKGLRYIFVAGEPFPRALEVKGKRLGLEAMIENIYGPTEGTIYSTRYSLSQPGDRGTVPIGKPMNNIRTYIVDKRCHLLPVQVPGELAIGGIGLARGYLNRPEFTHRRFVEDPFVKGGRLYLSGDLARWMWDGNIEFLGRIDNQVKIRGFRVELGEIESRLLEIEGVEETVVLARTNRSGEKCLCAYVVPSAAGGPGRPPISTRFREYLSHTLPDYMIPAYFVMLDSLPFTPSGKIDRKELPEPEPVASGYYTAPRNKLEENLLGIWSEVLGISGSHIGIDDNFFKLGGHSLKATSLVLKLHRQFNVKIPLDKIFELATIRKLAGFIKTAATAKYESVRPVERRDYYPLSPSQKRLFILQEMQPEAVGYNITGLVSLEGKLNKFKLKQDFEKLIHRHESLRTSFTYIDSEPVQVVLRQVDFNVEYYDLELLEVKSGGGDPELLDPVLRLVRPFDLSEAPLLRVGLFKTRRDRHLLLLDLHHIVADGGSVEILTRDFTALYRGEALAPLKIQYKEFSYWRQRSLSSALLRRQADYWQERFHGPIPVLNLPTDFTRPAVQSFAGRTVMFTLEERETAALRRLASAEGVTLFMMLLAVFNILLRKLSGQDDILVGTPVEGRPHGDLKNIVGMFVNTLALRHFPAASKSIRYFLNEVKESTLNAFDNQEFPFEELVDRLVVSRDPGRNPLFDVMFFTQDQGGLERGLESDGLRFEMYRHDSRISKFDLTLTGTEGPHSLGFSLAYCTRLFKSATIDRLIRYFKYSLQAILTDPARKIAEIEILPQEERDHLLYVLNEPPDFYSEEKTIKEMFQAQAAGHPLSVALVCADRHWSYGGLTQSCGRLAGLLRGRGVAAGDIVALLLEPGGRMIEAVMAVLTAGAAYLPIAVDYPDSRKEYLLKDSAARLLLTRERLFIGEGGSLPPLWAEGIDILFLDRQHSGSGGGDLPVVPQPHHPAYVLYTSGSTGRPRGVIVEHGNVVNLVAGLREKIYGGYQRGGLRVALVAPYVFDASVKQIFGALLSGHSLYVVPGSARQEGVELVHYFEKHRIDIADGTPTHIRLFHQLVSSGRLSWPKHLIIGGEELNGQILRAFMQSYGDRDLRVTNIYGLTECTVDSSLFDIGLEALPEDGVVPIGRPMRNQQIVILDSAAMLQPVGVTGELYIGGGGVARGYLNQPEETAQRFVDCVSESGGRWCRSGDLGRWLEDGNIEFRGRIDSQVKIRGYRIEPAEIESRLTEIDEIRQAVVVDRRDPGGEPYLCAYYVSAGEPAAVDLKEKLSRSLPDYMIPRYFVSLPAIPVTPNGKLDRRRLPEPEFSVETGYSPPRDELERQLATIWSDILPASPDSIGIDTDFFSLGGQSLKAALLGARIHQRWGVRLPLVDIFRSPTIRGLAPCIRGAAEEGFVSIPAVEKREYYLLSSAQRRLFVLHDMIEANVAYNMPALLKLTGEIDPAKFEAVLLKLINRHESLRTSFAIKGDQPVQVVHPRVDFKIEHFYMSASEAETAQSDRLTGAFIRPFELNKAPLLRVGLWRGGEECWLLVDMHHIVSDGASNGIFIREFISLYRGEKLPVLRIQYRDYACWQVKEKTSGRAAEQEAFWLRELAGELPILNLPSDFKRPLSADFSGRRLEFELDGFRVDRLKAFAGESGATLYMVLLSLLNVWLWKLSGQEDIVVGTPVEGRGHGDLGSVVGMFVNTLVMRNFPHPEKSFAYFLQEVKERTLTAFDNQDYQFDDLVERLSPGVDGGRNPLFDVMLVLQNMETAELAIPGMTINQQQPSQVSSKFDLSLIAVEENGRLRFHLVFRRSLFKQETVERWGGYFQEIVSAVSAVPDGRLGAIDILSEAERVEIFSRFNRVEEQPAPGRTVLAWFSRQVQKSPDRLALLFADHHWTYDLLNRRTNQAARLLRERGVCNNIVVGIMMERSLEMISGILGVVKTGSAYLPIDPHIPVQRKAMILEDSRIETILVQKKLSAGDEYLLENNQSVHTIVPGEEFVYSEASLEADVFNLPENIIYVIYTSGSTGIPKGVMVEHRSVTNILCRMQTMFPVADDDAYLFKTRYTFDVSVTEIFCWTLGGGRLVILDRDGERDPYSIFNSLVRQRVTHVNFVPSMLTAFLDTIALEQQSGEGQFAELRYLKYVMVAGEAFPGTLAQRVNKFGFPFQWVNIYGPTEATIYSTHFVLSKNNGADNETIPIGRPIKDVPCAVVSSGDNGHLLPVGIPGELWIGGAALARGYLNRPEQTFEKFIQSCFDGGGRWYRSGDRSRWLDNGNIEYLGRMDQQLKIRGFRVELGEIESQLLKHEAIKEAVVIAHGQESEDKYLAAYIIPVSSWHAAELKKYLRDRLPEYMIPSHFMEINSIPLTGSGKLNRRQLPEVIKKSTAALEAPATELEMAMAAIWAEILGMDDGAIGRDSNFFEIGGNSLKAIRVIARLQKEFKIRISLAVLFKVRTLSGLAACIRAAAEEGFVSIPEVEKREYYLLSSAQRRLFVLHDMIESNVAYNMPAVLKLTGEVEPSRFEAVLLKLINRHESLRTRFAIKGDQPVQVVHPRVDFRIEYFYMSTEEAEAAQLDRLVGEFIRPFELNKAPLLRAGLLRGSDGYWLLLDMHHIVADGASTGIFIREFISLYRGESLPDLRIQYRDYACWQVNETGSVRVAEQEAFWLREFSRRLPVLNLPLDFRRPLSAEFSGRRLEFQLDEPGTVRLNFLAVESGATLYIVLLALFYVWLWKLSGQEDIVVGTPVEGRGHGDLGSLVGMLVNTLALRNFPHPGKSFGYFLQEVRERTLAAFDNQDYQFDDLVERLSPGVDGGRNPLFDVMLVLQNMETAELAIPGMTIKEHRPSRVSSKFDLSLTAVEENGRLRFNLVYRRSLFRQETMERWGGYFREILWAVLSAPEVRLGAIDVVTEAERIEILTRFNRVEKQPLQGRTVVDWFGRQVQKTPDRLALLFADRHWTYDLLDRRINQTARLLRDRGASGNQVVGIMMERSLEMISGILGIVKAGSAYLPIDPHTPAQRQAVILEDSRIDTLLVHEHLFERDESILKNHHSVHAVVPGEELLYSEESPAADVGILPENIVYVIYTSGSTGLPKGVMVEHRSVTNILCQMQSMFPVAADDAYLFKTRYTFDVSVTEIFCWSLGGGRLVILDRDAEGDPYRIFDSLVRQRVTHVNFVPSMLTAFIDTIVLEPESGEFQLAELRYLKYAMVAGEAFPGTLAQQVKELGLPVRWVNIYGPTEATIYSTRFDLAEGNGADMETIPIGDPVKNVCCAVVTPGDDGHLLPVGIPGELWIGGTALARGYLNRPEQTAEKFVRPRFDGIGRWYRSGDLSRWLANGDIEYLGRMDQQLKIRGFRIELGEIESQLLKHEAVKEAVVMARGRESEDRYLAAYIVAVSSWQETELKDYLRDRLPEYMIPAHFIEIASVPLTGSGKIDRRKLPEVIKKSTSVLEAPATHLEMALSAIWTEILGLADGDIGRDTNFFEIGGNSLKAIRLIARLQNEFKIRISLAELFKVRTVRGLAGSLKRVGVTENLVIQPLEKREYYEVSYHQKRIWLIQRGMPGSALFNMSDRLVLKEGIDTHLLQRMLLEIMRRHEILRAGFRIIDGELVQYIKDAGINEIPFNLIDLSLSDPEQKEQEKKRLSREEPARPFSLLSTWPLFRVLAVKLAESQFEIMVTMHHIISDGWSMEIMKREFSDLINLPLNEGGMRFPPLKIQYKDFSAWHRCLLSHHESTAAAVNFWNGQLKGDIPVLDLPYDYLKRDSSSQRSSAYRTVIPADLTADLRRLAAEHEASLFMVLITGFYILMYHITGQHDILVGAPGAGRWHEDLKNILGFFVNTLVFRNMVKVEETLADFLDRVKMNTLQVLEYQDYPLEFICSQLKMKYPRISVFFNMLTFGEVQHRELEHTAAYHTAAVQDAKFELVLYITEFMNGLEINTHYYRDLFEPLTIENIIRKYVELLKEIVQDPNREVVKYFSHKKRVKKNSEIYYN